MFKNKVKRSGLSFILAVIFLTNSFNYPNAFAGELLLPVPGTMVHLSPEFDPPILKGIKVHPDNPFRFDFILDKGRSFVQNDPDRSKSVEASQITQEATKLIKYFLASLTIPEKDLWVNLSPYEKDRIVPQNFGLTQMGRDLLAEDYMLKQITASLIYPEDPVGKKFWKQIYAKAIEKYGTTNIPVNTFNKVWIVPEKALVYENAKAATAYVVESKLKVMLEQDYLSLEKHGGIQTARTQDTNLLGSQIVREIVIPELTKEVNENKNFIQLRQVYNSLILAAWYKKKIKDSILEQVYADKNKVAGIDIDDPQEKERIYRQYLKAFKKGVFNYIKEDAAANPGLPGKEQGIFPRKYFSGGTTFNAEALDAAMRTTSDSLVIPPKTFDRALIVRATISPLEKNIAGLTGDDRMKALRKEGRKGMERLLVKNAPDRAMNVNPDQLKDGPRVHLPPGLVNAPDVAKLFPESYELLFGPNGVHQYILMDRNPFVRDPKKSEGDYVATIDKDERGRPFLFINFNEYAIRALGDNQPEILQAIVNNKHEIGVRVAYSDYLTEAYIAYIRMMMSIRPKGLDRIFIANTGAEANENAFKALRFWRPKSDFVVSLNGAYHGRTAAALSVTSNGTARKGMFKFRWAWISFPESKTGEDGSKVDEKERNSLAEAWTIMERGKTRNKGEDVLETLDKDWFNQALDEIDRLLDRYNKKLLNKDGVLKELQALKEKLPASLFKEAEHVTGFIAEPYQGEGGMKFATGRYFQRLRCLTALFDVPIIFDEVQSGFFVTGTVWAHEAFDLPIPPDIVTFSKKTQTGGMYINERYDVKVSGILDSTWAGPADGIVRAVAIEKIIREEQLDKRAKVLGAYALEKLRAIEQRHPKLNLHTRGLGLVLALDFPSKEFRDQVVDAAWRRGLIINLAGAQTVRILPCFDTRESTIDEAFNILEEAITVTEKDHAMQVLPVPEAAMTNDGPQAFDIEHAEEYFAKHMYLPDNAKKSFPGLVRMNTEKGKLLMAISSKPYGDGINHNSLLKGHAFPQNTISGKSEWILMNWEYGDDGKLKHLTLAPPLVPKRNYSLIMKLFLGLEADRSLDEEYQRKIHDEIIRIAGLIKNVALEPEKIVVATSLTTMRELADSHTNLRVLAELPTYNDQASELQDLDALLAYLRSREDFTKGSYIESSDILVPISIHGRIGAQLVKMANSYREHGVQIELVLKRVGSKERVFNMNSINEVFMSGIKNENVRLRVFGADEQEVRKIEAEFKAILDQAMIMAKPGGIDFNSDKINLQIQNNVGGIKFHIDPAMLEQLKNTPGFVPVIINIQPMRDLKGFLEGVSLK